MEQSNKALLKHSLKMKIGVSFLKIGSEFQGIFTHAKGVVDDLLKYSSAEIILIIDDIKFKDILNNEYPNNKIIIIRRHKENLMRKLSIFVFKLFKINFLKSIFCKDFEKIENLNFDIIIHPNWSIYSFGLNVFSVASVHDTAFNNKDYKQGLLHKIKLKILVSYICKYSNLILCESHIGKDDIIREFQVQSKKIIVRYNLPSANFCKLSNNLKSELKNQLSVLQNKKYILLPSRWDQYKNQPRVMLAVEKYNTNNSDKIILVLTGLGNKVARVNEFINVNKLSGEHFIIYESISLENLVNLYKNAHCLIFPSLLGPTSIPLFEALETECPIITSNLDGHKEVLGDAAIYVDPLNTDSIYKSLNDLENCILSDLKLKMANQNRKLKLNQMEYSWIKTTMDTFALNKNRI